MVLVMVLVLLGEMVEFLKNLKMFENIEKIFF